MTGREMTNDRGIGSQVSYDFLFLLLYLTKFLFVLGVTKRQMHVMQLMNNGGIRAQSDMSCVVQVSSLYLNNITVDTSSYLFINI